MMKITTVETARKAQGSCESCARPIDVGEGYRWIQARYGPKRSRHLTCPIWRPSEMTSNDKLADLYAAVEQIEDALAEWEGDDLDSLRDVLNEAAENVRDVAERYRESASNIEDGFGHATSTSDEMNEMGDEVEAWADTLESCLESVDDRPDDDDLADEDDPESVLETWADDVRTAVEDALSEGSSF